MKCAQCNNEVKVKAAKFCPFCGAMIEKKEELAGYTRAEFFSATGNDEFKKSWEEVRRMSADKALAWLRENPPSCYVYKFFGEWTSFYDSGKRQNWARNIDIADIKYVSENGKVSPKKYKLSVQALTEIGLNAFFTEKECESAIKEEIERA